MSPHPRATPNLSVQRDHGTKQEPSSAAVFVDYVSLYQLVRHVVDVRGSFRAAGSWRCSQILCQALPQGKTENLSVLRDQLHNAGPRLRRSVRRLRVLASAGRTTRSQCSARQLLSRGHSDMLSDSVPSLAQGQNSIFERSRTPAQPQCSSTTYPCISWCNDT